MYTKFRSVVCVMYYRYATNSKDKNNPEKFCEYLIYTTEIEHNTSLN